MHIKIIRSLEKITLTMGLIGLSIGLAFANDPRDNNDPDNPDFPSNPYVSLATMVLSLSSDGHYAVSSNMDNQIILWNLQKHTHKIISNHAGMYSAYFIKHSPYFMWQSLPQGVPLLKLATSYKKPPANKLALVAQKKLGIISLEHGKFYFYFPGDKPNSIVKKLNPNTLNSHYLLYKNIGIGGEYFSSFKYDPKFIIDPDLNTRYRFLKVIMDLGYHSGNIVHVQDPDGKEVLHFDHFPVYGQAMRANLKDYFAVSYPGSLYKSYGNDEHMMMLDNSGLGGKLLSLSLADKKPLLSTSGDATSDTPLVTGKNVIFGNMDPNHLYSELTGVTLWNTQTGQPIHKFFGNAFKTFATLSPDANYLIAGDENIRAFMWSTQSFKKIMTLPALNDKRAPIKIPAYFNGPHNESGYTQILAFKFIDKTHFLRFSEDDGYAAILYDIHSPWPIKYFPLGNIDPAVYTYMESAAIDTSPSAHILVMAMSGQRGGILVYHYDPKKMTLTRVWAAHLPVPPNAKHVPYATPSKHKQSKTHWWHW